MDEIKSFVKGLRTWLDLEESTPTKLTYSTRAHGDMEHDEVGEADKQEIRRVGLAVKAQFPTVTLDWEGIDEWAYLYIILSEKPKVPPAEPLRTKVDYTAKATVKWSDLTPAQQKQKRIEGRFGGWVH